MTAEEGVKWLRDKIGADEDVSICVDSRTWDHGQGEGFTYSISAYIVKGVDITEPIASSHCLPTVTEAVEQAYEKWIKQQ